MSRRRRWRWWSWRGRGSPALGAAGQARERVAALDALAAADAAPAGEPNEPQHEIATYETEQESVREQARPIRAKRNSDSLDHAGPNDLPQNGATREVIKGKWPEFQPRLWDQARFGVCLQRGERHSGAAPRLRDTGEHQGRESVDHWDAAVGLRIGVRHGLVLVTEAIIPRVTGWVGSPAGGV